MNPEETVQRHIKLLHEYNEIRDVALSFAGKIAEKEQCRTIDVLKEYGMNEKDWWNAWYDGLDAMRDWHNFFFEFR